MTIMTVIVVTALPVLATHGLFHKKLCIAHELELSAECLQPFNACEIWIHASETQ